MTVPVSPVARSSVDHCRAPALFAVRPPFTTRVVPLNMFAAESVSMPPPSFVSEDRPRIWPESVVEPEPAIVRAELPSIVPRIESRPDESFVQVCVPARLRFTAEPLAPIVTAPEVAFIAMPPVPRVSNAAVLEAALITVEPDVLNESPAIVTLVERSEVTPLEPTDASLKYAVPVAVGAVPPCQLVPADHVPVVTVHVVWASAARGPQTDAIAARKIAARHHD